MRRVLLGTTIAALLVAAAPAAAYPSRQPCTIDLDSTSIDHPVPVTSTGKSSVVMDMIGDIACNFQAAQPTTGKAYLTVTGCSQATGYVLISMALDGWRYDTALIDFTWYQGEAHFTVQTPIGFGTSEAVPSTDLANGWCLTGLDVHGGFVYNLWAGTPYGN